MSKTAKEKAIEAKDLVNPFLEAAFPVSDRKALSHSEIVALSMEGYAIDRAQDMAYDPEDVDTSSGRLDTFRMDWFDAAQVSQEIQQKAPVVSKIEEDKVVEDEVVKSE